MGGLRNLTPHRPPPEGAAGNGMLPVFLQHLPPQSGRAGNETMALFFPGFPAKKPAGVIFSQIWLNLAPPQNALSFIKKTAGAIISQIWLNLAPPQNALIFHQKNRPLPQLVRSD